jgi:hypothetical protein
MRREADEKCQQQQHGRGGGRAAPSAAGRHVLLFIRWQLLNFCTVFVSHCVCVCAEGQLDCERVICPRAFRKIVRAAGFPMTAAGRRWWAAGISRNKGRHMRVGRFGS